MASQISVALATYNGAAYLDSQLAGIAAQTLPPDELVVCDDGSTDATAQCIERFAARAPFPVRFSVQPRQLGAAQNFASAIEQCTGRWIALADQDDLWLPDKLATLAALAVLATPATPAASAANTGASLVFSDAEAVDAQGRPLGYTLWNALRFGRREQAWIAQGRALDVLLRRNVVSGATVLFRADLRELLLPIPPGWMHDGWLALLAAAFGEVRAVARPLVRYRQHAGQQIGAPRLWEQYRRGKTQGRQHFESAAALYDAAAARLAEHAGAEGVHGVPGIAAAIDKIRVKADHLRRRASMRDSRWRLPQVCREWWLGNYTRYSSGWRAVAQDVFL